jgi:hypothetical protein
MMAVVEFGRVLDRQDGLMLTQGLDRPLGMGPQ